MGTLLDIVERTIKCVGVSGVAGVYTIKNDINGKVYIGSTKNLLHRKRQHFVDLRRGKHINKHLLSAFKKYGENSFSFIPLLLCDTINLLFYEQLLINKYNPEYNLSPTAGSCLGTKRSPEFCERNRLNKLGSHYRGSKRSPEQCEHIRQSKIGNNNLTAYRYSPKRIENSSKARLGMKHTVEHRKHISMSLMGNKRALGNKSLLGRKHTLESIEKIRLAKIGKKHTQQTREKMSQARIRYLNNKNGMEVQ